MIVDQAVYRDGRRQPCADLSDELAKLADVPDGFLWIGLKDPTDAEFDLVKGELGLHPLAIEDAVNGNQRAKMEVYDGSLFVVLKPLRYIEESSQVETGEVMLFVGEHFVVTVRRGEANPLAEVRRRLEANSEHLAYGPAAVLHAVMDDVVDRYVAIDDEIAHDLEQMEESVFAGEVEVEASALGDAPPPVPHRRRGGEEARRIYLLKREVLEFRRAAVPLKDAMLRLHQHPTPNVPDEARPFFRDVADHLLRVIDHIESYDRLLSDILSAHLTRVSVQQNDDMRRISAWAAIGVAVTLIAGVYGMNFRHMPELAWTFGYPMAIGLMLVVSTVLYRQFKKSGWL
ncbi:magnesium and cobalt transport protein CorA [Angustibacter sp. McL0619]|uniref:magnesium and cobalt transport protein CorA n=1 Tax=Angustibacter sp. McL0619 TaxID=3415676 RepID=UPI003CEB6246